MRNFLQRVKQHPSLLVLLAFALTGAGMLTGATSGGLTSPRVFIAFGFLGLCATLLEVFVVETPPIGHASTAVCIYSAAFMILDFPLAAILVYWAVLAATVLRWIFASQHLPLQKLAVQVCSSLIPVLGMGAGYRFAAGSGDLLDWRHLAALGLAAGIFGVLDYGMSLVQQEFVPAADIARWARQRNKSRLFSAALIPGGLVIALLYANKVLPYAAGLLVPLALLRLGLIPVRTVEEKPQVDEEDIHTSLSLLEAELSEYKAQNKLIMVDLQKRVDEIAILSETGHLLGASLDLDKTLEIIISMIRKLIFYQSCVIFLVGDKGQLVARDAVSPYKEVLEMGPLQQIEESMVGLVMQSRKPLLQVMMQAENPQRIFKDEQAVMCVPLIVKNEIIGVIYVGTLRPNAYTADLVHLLEMIANPSAIAIKSSQLFEEQEEKNRELEQANAQRERQIKQQADLKMIADSLAGAVDLHATMRTIVDKMKEVISCRTCIVFQLQKTGDRVWMVGECNSPYEAFLADYTSTPGEGLLDNASHLKDALLILDARSFRTPDGVEIGNDVLVNERSIMLAPLRTKDDVTALLYAGDGEANKFTTEQLRLFETIAMQVAITLEKAELYEGTKEQAITDGCTGLYTHRYFQERLIEECKWSERQRKPLSLIMVDTDHFKRFNDTLGHPQGDSLLREIASLLRDSCRDSDLVCRYGGDEFTMILKETEKEVARRIAERIREAFELRFGKHAVKVTASIGVACFPSDAATKAELVKAADAALYESKRRGRNQVNIATKIQVP